MIKGLKRHNKKKAFTLVELMLLLVVLSLVIASSYSLITRKHRLVPRKSVHGQYACFMEPVVNDDTNEVTYDIRELEISGDTVLHDSKNDPEPPERCQFNFPKNASYVFMQVVGGGGAGGNANYKISDSTYKHLTYERSINLVERDWARREKNTPGSVNRKYVPKDSNSGVNRISSITSWGGTTIVDGSGGYKTFYPRVDITVNSENKSEAEVPEGDTYAPSASHRKLNPRRGITRKYVDDHFTFNAYEKQVDLAQSMVRKGNYLDVHINGDSSNLLSLFDSNLFQYIVRNYVVENMFVYDIGGGGPTAPGVLVKPLKTIDPSYPYLAYNCRLLGNDGYEVPLSNCLVTAFNGGNIGSLSGKTAARNEWCSLPIRPFANASANSATVCSSNGNCSDSYKLTTDEENYINNNMSTIMSYCPIMYQHYRRQPADFQQCYGGDGGSGSYFTSVPVPFSYGFFPVLGIRWNRDTYLVEDSSSPLNCDPNSGLSNFMCDYIYGGYKCDKKESGDDNYQDGIDFSCYRTVENATISSGYNVRLKEFGSHPEVAIPSETTDMLSFLSGYSSYKGHLKACSVTPPNETDCVQVQNVWYDKAQGIGGTRVKAPAFVSDQELPQIESWISWDKNGSPVMKDWNYWVGGYPHGFSTAAIEGLPTSNNKGYGVGVGFIIERDNSFVNSQSTNDNYNRTMLTKPLATACIAPGIMAFNNTHQFDLAQTAANQSPDYTGDYVPMFDGTYIPIPNYFGGAATMHDVNALNKDLSLSTVNTVAKLRSNYLNKHLNGHYYKWLHDLAHNSSPHSWLGCTSSNPENIVSCFYNITYNNSDYATRYLNEAFGMRNCDQGGSTNCYTKEVSGKHYKVADCLKTPLKNPAIPSQASYESPSDNPNSVMAAEIPKAFGTPGTKPVTDAELEHVYDSGGALIHPYYVLNLDGSLNHCPGKQGYGSNGNSAFDSAKSGRLVFVGRTGLFLKEGEPGTSIRTSVLNAPSETFSPNNTVTLGGEDEVGLKIKLHYYKHALTHGTPGQSGEYKTVFARAFTNSNVIVEPGAGGLRLDIDPGNAGTHIENNGKDTVLKYNCDSNNENCAGEIVAHGGPGGVSYKLDDETEYAQLHQTPEFIKKAIEKLNSIKNNGHQDSIPAPGPDGTVDTMSSPDTFNIFPHCSKAAPRYQKDENDTEHENVAKYMIGDKTVIDSTCYGSGIVEADDSYFAADAGLFDLKHITNDIDITTVGKGGDGGFVRDDCWVVPQYFEIKGLFDTAIPSEGGLVYNEKYNGLNNKKADGTDFTDARTTDYGVLPNFTDDTIYEYFNGDKYENLTNAEKMRLSGYTGIYPNKLYSQNGSNAKSCRNRANRYTGSTTYMTDSQNGQSAYFRNGYNRVGYRAYGYNGNATYPYPSQYATEIQATEGQPGGVFITW